MKRGEKMIITIANQKGGCGKTTTATAITSILKERGYKTLLIDSDPQGNSTDTYKAQYEGKPTLYDVLLDDERISSKEAIQETNAGEIIAADPLLREADSKLLHDIEGLYRLKDSLEILEGYDFIVIDTAPNMNTILYNSLIAADMVIIPVTADRYSLQGLSQFNQTLQGIKKRHNTALRVGGLLIVKYHGRTRLAKEAKAALENIAEQMKTKVYQTTIRESTKAREAQATRQTLTEYAPTSTTAQDYNSFIDELLKEV